MSHKVSLRHQTTLQHFCAGTLIHPQWVLTAAHCFTYTKDPKELLLQYGSNALRPSKRKLVNVSEVLRHEGYSQTIAIHDIALLRLEKEIMLDKADLALLAVDEYCREIPASKESPLLVGWGLNATEGKLQQQLHKVELNLINRTKCRQRTQSTIYGTNLCAGVTDGTVKGQCNGDSGGPLLLNRKQIGIVSWSLKPCGSYPGIFTNVGCYESWINTYIKNKNKFNY